MHQALETLFDHATESALRKVWAGLRDAGLDATMLDLGARPHVSLAVYDAPLLLDRQGEIEAFFSEVDPLPISLASVGSFPGDEGVVFLAPVVTEALLGLHARWHERFDALRGAARPHYLPGAWVPHCTMAFHVKPRLLPAAVEFVRTADLPLTGMLTHASVIEFDAADPSSLRSCCEFALGGEGE